MDRPDRLGALQRHRPSPPQLLSYGEEIASTNNDTFKFAQLYRDGDTGLDYAVNRYSSSTIGRFLTVDPYRGSADSTRPQSRNRYSYAENDPVTFADPAGLYECVPGRTCAPPDPQWVICTLLVGNPSCTGNTVNVPVEASTGPQRAQQAGRQDIDLSSRGLTCIKSYEGFSEEVYKDSAGKDTIGYGHLIKEGEDFSGGITEERAAELLAQDANWAVKAVRSAVKVELSQDQFDALASFTFNVGRGNLAKSTLLSNLNSGKAVIEENFTAWNKAGGQVIAGLTNRRKDEYNLFANGKSDRCP